MRSLGLLLLTLLILSGCTRLPEKLSDTEQASLWLQHQIDVNQVLSWYINGRVGIKTDQQSGSASIFWQQTGANYEMRIVAPLGQGTYIFTGSPEGVQMRGPDELLLFADTPEELMQTGLGWSVDLRGLRYWVRGIPAPDMAYKQLSLDGSGRLGYLDQSGFSIEIQRYATVEDLVLPEKLVINSPDLQLKMLIKNWEL